MSDHYDSMKRSILDMFQGAIKKRVDQEMAKILDNILNDNTKPDDKRKLVLTITIQPDVERTNLAVDAQVKSTLAPAYPVLTTLYVAGSDKTGEVHVLEKTAQLPGQLDMGGGEQEPPAVLNVVSIR